MKALAKLLDTIQGAFDDYQQSKTGVNVMPAKKYVEKLKEISAMKYDGTNIDEVLDFLGPHAEVEPIPTRHSNKSTVKINYIGDSMCISEGEIVACELRPDGKKHCFSLENKFFHHRFEEKPE